MISLRRTAAPCICTLLLALAGCRPHATSDQPVPTPREALSPQELAASSPILKSTTAAPSTPMPAAMKEIDEEPPRTPPQLQAAYLAAQEISDKVEIIYDLGNLDTGDAIYTLMRLFEAEKDEDLKQEMIDATERMEAQLPAKLAFLAIALRPDQPVDIRDTAVGLLLTIEDRRAIPIWQLLLKDTDSDRRELAQQQIEDLQQLSPDGF